MTIARDDSHNNGADGCYMKIKSNNVDEPNPGHGKVVAKDCTFNGAIFGVADGTFENCTFDRINRDDWYPVYESLGSATFKNCVFGKYGLRFTEGDYADQAPFNYDYIVCSEAVGGVFDFQNCSYSNGAAFDTEVFVISYDGYPSKVTINGTEYTDMSVFGTW